MSASGVKGVMIKIFGRLGRMILVFLGVIIACAVILTGVLLACSQGKPAPYLDGSGKPLAGSISEKIHVNINGVEQGMFIKGRDRNNPVLLFLHGGPGMPEYAVSRKYPQVLENYFTVCWWEQRDAGLSYDPGIKPEDLTFEQLISDTLEVTNYLRKRFGQQKIYLLGHSGGSFIGIQAAARAPELYKAYIGMGQISNQLESEKLAYEYMTDQFARLGDKRMLNKLKEYPVTDLNTPSYQSMRDAPMHKLGIGTTHNMKSVISGVFLPVMLNKEYTLGEKINIWRGKIFISKTVNLWGKLVDTDLTGKVRKLDIPVYFLEGAYDYTCSHTLAKDYFEKLQAPVKGFYTFSQSAHSPLFEEPDKAGKILKEDVLAGRNSLSDAGGHSSH